MNKLSLLAEAREKKATWKANMNAIIEQAKSTYDYQNSERLMKEAEALEASLTEQIKDEALQAFEADGNKKRDGVTIKEFTVVEIYDEGKAREWCMNNFRPALKLDLKTFENAAKDGNIPGELALVETEPRAQIATDLSKYLPTAIPGPEQSR